MVINRGDEAAVAKHPSRRHETNIRINGGKASARYIQGDRSGKASHVVGRPKRCPWQNIRPSKNNEKPFAEEEQ
jgi:hypothetical protein